MPNDIDSKINIKLEKANQDYAKVHELTANANISDRLGGYLKSLVYMRSCLNIAQLFAGYGDRKGMYQRIWEAQYKLKEIYYVYGQEDEEKTNRIELAIRAGEEFEKNYLKCEKLLERVA